MATVHYFPDPLFPLMSDFVQTLITALAIGSLYALIALGYTMVYGILKFINFAHSDIVVLGAWLSYTLAVRILPSLGLDPHNPATVPPFWVAAVVMLAAMVFCGVIGFAIERLAYRRLRPCSATQCPDHRHWRLAASAEHWPTGFRVWSQSSENAGFAAELGIGVDHVWRGRIGSTRRFGADRRCHLFSCHDADASDAVPGISHEAGCGDASCFIQYRQCSGTMGIPVDRVVSFTFVLGSVLAAAAGFLYVTKYPSMNQPAHAVWVLLGLKAFVAAVIGGIGNVRAPSWEDL